MRALIVIMLLGVLAGCASVPVDKPCGVIRDSLSSVKATTAGGQQRLDVHYERGRSVGCWQ